MSAQITGQPWFIVEPSREYPSRAIVSTDSGVEIYNAPLTRDTKEVRDCIACVPDLLEYLRLRAAGGDETAALLLLKAGQ